MMYLWYRGNVGEILNRFLNLEPHNPRVFMTQLVLLLLRTTTDYLLLVLPTILTSPPLPPNHPLLMTYQAKLT